MLISRLSLPLLTNSSTAATVQVAPRWIAKPIRPAHSDEMTKAALIRRMSMRAARRGDATGKASVEGRLGDLSNPSSYPSRRSDLGFYREFTRRDEITTTCPASDQPSC